MADLCYGEQGCPFQRSRGCGTVEFQGACPLGDKLRPRPMLGLLAPAGSCLCQEQPGGWLLGSFTVWDGGRSGGVPSCHVALLLPRVPGNRQGFLSPNERQACPSPRSFLTQTPVPASLRGQLSTAAGHKRPQMQSELLPLEERRSRGSHRQPRLWLACTHATGFFQFQFIMFRWFPEARDPV